MARLLITSPGFDNQIVTLRLGTTRIGRSSSNDYQLDHPTISGVHCEIQLGEGELLLRDCGSTNGTYINGKSIKEAKLKTGETFRLGDVELLVETTDFTIAIPQFEVPRPEPPVVLADGALLCPRHPTARVTHQCTHCQQVLCDRCVRRIRRRGGKLLKLCPLCSHACVLLASEPAKKRSLFEILQKTVKLPFVRIRRTKRK